jgi:hypothetical protein
MITTYIDVKYANILSGRLKNFKVKKSNPYLANFSCPLCGDSEKSKFKARGYLFQQKGEMFFKCHNCGISVVFGKFLQIVDTILHDEYAVEIFKAKNDEPQRKPITDFTPPKFLEKGAPLRKLKKISQLPSYHPAKQYIVSRQIENKWHAKLFYCEKFVEFTNSLIPGKLDTEKETDMIIIPLLTREGELFGYQGRSLNPKAKMRYVTIMLNETFKLFGYDTVNLNMPIYVVEGAFDSMFLTNGVAALQGDLLAVRNVLPVEKCIFIPDRDVRNKEVMKLAKKIIDDGQQICMLPESFPGKDLNEAILNGMCFEEMSIMINQNVYQGLAAQLHYLTWSKCG